MKTILQSSYNPTFTPGAAGTGTLNFATAVSAVSFNFQRLMAVIDLTTNTVIFAAGQSGAGGTWNSGSSVLTLTSSTSSCASGDLLEVIWDDPSASVVIAPPTLSSAASSSYHYISTASTNLNYLPGKQSSAGVISAIYFTVQAGQNSSAYLRFYDSATTPTVGTSSVKLTFAGMNYWNAQNQNPIMNTTAPVIFVPASGIKFSNGIWFSITAGNLSDSDTTATAANLAALDVLYV